MSIICQKQLDTVEFSRTLYDETTRSMTFTSKTRPDAEEWQRNLRSLIVKLLGYYPSQKSNLSPRIVSMKEFESYTRETVLFQSRQNMTVFGYFLLPKSFHPPLPAILCLHGHGRGVDDIVGIKHDASTRIRYGGYQKDFAIQCVNKGYAVLAIEQFGFGRRRDEGARHSGSETSSCQPSAGAALLLGQTMISWRVWDAMRSLDYLLTRPEIDIERMGIIGISGGATTSFFAAAIDKRIKTAVISGYFNTFFDSILSINHCIDNYIPGILQYAEMYDIAGLIAPRALFVETGSKDKIFPVGGTRFALNKANEIFHVLGAKHNLGFEVFDGHHEFHGVGAFKFLSKTL